MDHDLIEQAARQLAAANHTFCLTGAGVSAESGVPTFRDARTGLWARFDPAQLASQEGFATDPGRVWRWYMDRLAMAEAAIPNPGHRALARLEQLLPTFVLFTQNVDELHERAGSQRVYHLHGCLARFRCNDCGRLHELQPQERKAPLPPRCSWCGGWIRPDVVWFGENLPPAVLDAAWQALERCDVMLVVGTSGEVYPAALFPQVAREAGARVIEINTQATAITPVAHVSLRGTSGQLLPRLWERVVSLREGRG
ncbi:SIR2 family NAD-dependent protein deacylase [Litorilinea aerophila]|uniref:NAD-dependent protein deacylase n=1 Tax=Litorilinea aerophila TaxID=1204385 RepID=A0A540VD53_9CHLR